MIDVFDKNMFKTKFITLKKNLEVVYGDPVRIKKINRNEPFKFLSETPVTIEQIRSDVETIGISNIMFVFSFNLIRQAIKQKRHKEIEIMKFLIDSYGAHVFLNDQRKSSQTSHVIVFDDTISDTILSLGNIFDSRVIFSWNQLIELFVEIDNISIQNRRDPNAVDMLPSCMLPSCIPGSPRFP